MELARRQLFVAYVLSAVVVLIAAGGSILFVETATVKLSVPPHRVATQPTLWGGLPTERIHADVTDSQQGTASTVQVAPTYASGLVVFHCSPACQKAVSMPPGTLVTSAKSLGYATQAAVTVATTGDSAPVPVRATAPGASWNAEPGTLTVVPSSQEANLHVTNSAAIAGGADARTAQVIQQSDFDAVRNALTVKVNDELAAALKVNALGMNYISDALPTINVTSDHNVGDEVASFSITLTGTIGAIAFSESQAQTLLRSALQAQVPTSEVLTQDPIQAVYQVGQAGASGDVVLIAKASGYVIPKLSTLSLRAQIKGLTPTQAARALQGTAPGSTVEIRISPTAVPWLPVVVDHISLTVVVQPAAVPFAGG